MFKKNTKILYQLLQPIQHLVLKIFYFKNLPNCHSYNEGETVLTKSLSIERTDVIMFNNTRYAYHY